MSIDLSSVGMKKGQQYETIITTMDSEGKKNGAPIGVICKDKYKVMCRIFKGSKTLDNIILNNEFIVNITLNPILFTLATIGNIPEDFFIDSNIENRDKNNNKEYRDKYRDKKSTYKNLPVLNDVDAYLICKVIDIKNAFKKSDPIKKSEAKVIIANVEDIILNNKCAKAANRGFYCLIESLVNFTRFDIVDSEKKDYFLDRFNESKRVVNKVGSSEEKKAIELLGETFKNKGYETD
ncbi:hypothetical protein MBBAR_14c00210 [Methanobrevibacter arboriphilus JCM 13429 = DSM 1125]|uniref:DUF447 family protein n=1 Tax=Methanobrevibacter arboriphilus JCM 13429 = DSM 1125 TaxID=1300164 RepID=A0A1V6N186_METAZ|nr:DUF447 domain-containing protein [Methanobrevibacter arboriphilus]OQD58490.1 hypothetical protein MBBAR_14c00210 [Methanobrevibacter arboriphilus JCM 13429 = DSM 1125]